MRISKGRLVVYTAGSLMEDLKSKFPFCQQPLHRPIGGFARQQPYGGPNGNIVGNASKEND